VLFRSQLITHEIITSYGGALDFNLGSRLRLSLHGQRSARDANNPLFNYTSTLVGITAGVRLL